MCGITGIFDTRGGAICIGRCCRRMNQTQFHRGPDEERHHEPVCGAGTSPAFDHRSVHGQQPLFNEDGSVVVVYNGEIYNYPELIPNFRHSDMYSIRAVTPRDRACVGGLGCKLRATLPAACSHSPVGSEPRDVFSWRATAGRKATVLRRCWMMRLRSDRTEVIDGLR